MKKGKIRHKKLSETFVEFFAEFWSDVNNSRGWGSFPNLYKLVRIYIVQPHSSIECEGGC